MNWQTESEPAPLACLQDRHFTLHASLDNVEWMDDQRGRCAGREASNGLEERGREAGMIGICHRDG
jgi:hypothetical protein